MIEEIKDVELSLKKLGISPDRVKSIHIKWMYVSALERAFPSIDIELYKNAKKSANENSK